MNAPGDKYEQEADRIADQVVKQLNVPHTRQSGQIQTTQNDNRSQDETVPEKPQISPIGQHQPLGDAILTTPELEASIQKARGSGQRLPDHVREPTERIFGADFSGIRVHANTESDRLNQSLNTHAFTTGQDIFFRQGAYQPGSQPGQKLIAHELTHVVQQRGMRTPLSDTFIQACGPFTAFQGTHTADCGYFSAYVVAQNSPEVTDLPPMTTDTVAERRTAFQQSKGLRPGHYWLTVQDLVEFLEFLHVPGYQAYPNIATPRYPHTQDGFKRRVQNSADRGGGVILLLEAGGGGGHYVAVLNTQGPDLCCYDPGNRQWSRPINADLFARGFWEATTWFIASR